MSDSPLEETLYLYMRALKIPLPEREVKFNSTKKWRYDFIWEEHMLIVEVEGGIWTNGRHVRGKGFTEDCEKYNEATLLGWKVIRVTAEHIKNGKALEWIERALSV